jgi:Ca2+-binding EF-hand superfamily protein
MSNLTPAQLEQFESTFRYFDRNETNTLELAEMTAALASLGIVYSVSCIQLVQNPSHQSNGSIGGRSDYYT